MIEEPTKGTRISAEWGSRVARSVNALTPMAADGMLARGGAFWNGAEPLPQNRRVRTKSSHVPTCFSLVPESGPNGPRYKFTNTYFQVGSEIFTITNTYYTDIFVCQGDPQGNDEYTENDLPYVFLYVRMRAVDSEPAGTGYIDARKTFEEVVQAAFNPAIYVKPLYKLTHGGTAAIDLRNMPQLAAFEISSPAEVRA